MEQIEEFLYLGFAILIFCFALWIYLIQYREIERIIFIEKDSSDAVFYQSAKQEAPSNFIRQEELLGYFFVKLSCDIEVNGILYQKGETYLKQLEEDLFRDSYYWKQILYEEDGEIKRLIFTGY